MPHRKIHLVAYDIREEHRLKLVARVLESYGDRVQYSVFRCRLTGKNQSRMLWELAKVMAPEDSLLIIPVCEICNQGVIERGQPMSWPRSDPSHVIF